MQHQRLVSGATQEKVGRSSFGIGVLFTRPSPRWKVIVSTNGSSLRYPALTGRSLLGPIGDIYSCGTHPANPASLQDSWELEKRLRLILALDWRSCLPAPRSRGQLIVLWRVRVHGGCSGVQVAALCKPRVQVGVPPTHLPTNSILSYFHHLACSLSLRTNLLVRGHHPLLTCNSWGILIIGNDSVRLKKAKTVATTKSKASLQGVGRSIRHNHISKPAPKMMKNCASACGSCQCCSSPILQLQLVQPRRDSRSCSDFELELEAAAGTDRAGCLEAVLGWPSVHFFLTHSSTSSTWPHVSPQLTRTN